MNQNKKLKTSKLQKMNMGKFIRIILLSISTCVSVTFLLWCYVIYEIKSPTPTIKALGILTIFATFIMTSILIYVAGTVRENNNLIKDSIELGDTHMAETVKISCKINEVE